MSIKQPRWRQGGDVPVEGHPAGLDPRDVHDELLVVVGAPPPPPPSSSSSFSSSFFLLPPLFLLQRRGRGRRRRWRGLPACVCACVRCVWAGWASGVKFPLCRVPPIWHLAKVFFNFFNSLSSAPDLALGKLYF